MRKALHTLLLVVLLPLPGSFAQIHDPSIRHKNVESYFATKTTYEHRIREEGSLPWTEENIPTDLKPVLIDATLRHGTRFPSTKRIEIWERIVPRFRMLIAVSEHSEISKSFKTAVLDWKNRFPAYLSFLLSSLGWKEHTNLGFKYYSMMPELWSEIFAQNGGVTDDHELLVLSSRKIRCLASAKVFLNAIQIYNHNGYEDWDHPDVKYEEEKVEQKSNEKNELNIVECGKIPVLVNDSLLRFFDECEKYVHTVDKNETAEHEFENLFKKMPGILPKIPEIKDKKDVYYIYQLCAFEMAVFGDSIWCEIFTEKDLTDMEYASDLKHYYKTGHGYSVNVAQSCVLLEHVLGRMKNKPKNQPRATLRFGHAETLIPLVGLLGFYQENKHLKSSDEHSRDRPRVFQTGKISPFSGNLAIVVYESRTDPQNKSISFAINEQLIKPFGLNCFFCEFGPESIAYRELEKRLEGCDSVCELDKPIVKDEL